MSREKTAMMNKIIYCKYFILVISVSALLFMTSCSPDRISVREPWVDRGSKDTNTIIIFVHGIFSSKESCWLADNGKYWPDIIKEDANFQWRSPDSATGIPERPAIYLCDYSTTIDSGSRGTAQCADDVFRELQRIDKNGNSILGTYNNIIFVCHSTGGVVVRKILVSAQNFDYFKNKNIGLVLMASPSSGSQLASSLSWLARLYNNELAQDLSLESKTLRDLDFDFRKVISNDGSPNGRLHVTGIEGLETYFIIHRWWWPDGFYVVPPSSGNKYFPAEYLPGQDHFSTVKPDSMEHPSYLLLYDFFSRQFLDFVKHRNAEERGSSLSPDDLFVFENELRVSALYSDYLQRKTSLGALSNVQTSAHLLAETLLNVRDETIDEERQFEKYRKASTAFEMAAMTASANKSLYYSEKCIDCAKNALRVADVIYAHARDERDVKLRDWYQRVVNESLRENVPDVKMSLAEGLAMLAHFKKDYLSIEEYSSKIKDAVESYEEVDSSFRDTWPDINEYLLEAINFRKTIK